MKKEIRDRYILELLDSMIQQGGTDLFITAGACPSIKVDGRLQSIATDELSSMQANALVKSIMNDHQLNEFEANKECNFAINLPAKPRFRVNAFRQRNHSGMVCRIIHSDIPSLDQLRLPQVFKDIAMASRGLVLVVGGTGSGKSTSMAAMVGHRNQNSHGHIVTIEDPIEFVHQHQGCIVTQREVGVDTDSYACALKNTLRQAPDVIMLGEIRDRESMEYALTFAETGHLCMATLHANSADQAIERIINFFPQERRMQLLMDISMNLRACISQRLLAAKNSSGRVPAIEILLNTPLVAELIFKGEITKLKSLMAVSQELGMQTFDQSLLALIKDNAVSVEDGLRHADSLNDLRLKLKLEGNSDLTQGTEGWTVANHMPAGLVERS